ncbi:exported hypothetical protein [Flavobacterium sp. 9AF]|uniref:hypothetical protein n=1 Tax=Flavobacterium sp. 9AF TaxID=2653142 RepID=UPI0012F05A58|nr:hypothetical protein [Flavobacterium sp. 9AF]VXC17842.1 exported hypothetical protein [Flavobacterium sp. 9AF]
MKRIYLFLFAVIILLFSNCEKDFDTNEHSTNKDNFNFKTITFNEVTKINKKASLKVLELKSNFLQKNAIIQGVLVDTTNIIHLQREDGFSSFSFKIQQDINLTYFQNLVIENFPNGEQRTLLVKFNLNTPLLFLDKQSISNATTSIETTNLSNNTSENRGTGSDCITVGYWETVDACEGELVTPSENPRCFNADGSRATKEVFITIAEDCSDGSGGGDDGGFNGNPPDSNNGGDNNGSNNGGTYNGAGIFIPNIYTGDDDPNNPDFVLSGQVADYFNALPQNIKSLTNNNTWVYAYLVDYFRNHGNTVNNRNTLNATTALNNFYTFQLSSYSPNLSHVAHEKLNFWAYYNFLNNNISNVNTQTIFNIKDYVIQTASSQNDESVIDYLFDNYQSNEALAFIEELINRSVETGLTFDIEKSLKSPAYIDFSEIDKTTPEGQKLDCIYKKLTNSPEFKRLFEGTFGGDQQKLNIKFKMQANLVDADGDIVRARCNPEHLNIQAGGTGNYQEIIYNSDQLAGPDLTSNIYIAKSIIHELIHAYLNVKFLNTANGPSLTFLSDLELEELLEQVFNTNDPLQLGINQHNFMSQHMIPEFQTILSEIITDLIPQSDILVLNNTPITDFNGNFIENFNFQHFYTSLAYEGLHHTDSYLNNIENNVIELRKHQEYNRHGRNSSQNCL